MSSVTTFTKIRRIFGRILLLLALFYAVGMSGYLAWAHYQKIADPTYQSACVFKEEVGGLPMDCDKVNTSEYSEFYGVPLGMIGGSFFLSMVLLGFLGMGRYAPRKRDAMSLILGGTIASFFYSLFLLYIQVYEIGKLCPFCVTIYVANLIAFIGWLLAKERGFVQSVGDLAQTVLRFYRSRAFLGAAFLFFLSLTATHAAYLLAKRQIFLDRTELMLANLNLAPTVHIDLTEDSPILGPEEADYSIVAFSDLGCPYCRNAAKKIHRLMETFPGRIQLVYRHFPLDETCNPNVPYTLHEGACEAAKIGVCAQRAGRFWEYHDRLYDRQALVFQGDISANLLREALMAGLDRGALEECLEDPATQERLEADIHLGSRLRIESTPSFLLNRRSFYLPPFALSGRAIEYFKPIIQANALLDKAQPAPSEQPTPKDEPQPTPPEMPPVPEPKEEPDEEPNPNEDDAPVEIPPQPE